MSTHIITWPCFPVDGFCSSNLITSMKKKLPSKFLTFNPWIKEPPHLTVI